MARAAPAFAPLKPGYALPRQPPPRGFAPVVVGGFEHRLGEGGLDAQGRGAVVGEAVLAAGRDDDELARGEGDVGFADPHVGLFFKRAIQRGGRMSLPSFRHDQA